MPIKVSEKELDNLVEVFQKSLVSSQNVRVAIINVLKAAPTPIAIPSFAYVDAPRTEKPDVELTQEWAHLYDIDLPRKERKILLLLASRPNRWFHSDKIVEEIYSDDDEPIVPHQTMYAHMSKLKRKLAKLGIIIESRRWIGYRLKVVPTFSQQGNHNAESN